MADLDVSINEAVAIADSPAAYQVGGGVSLIQTTLLGKDIDNVGGSLYFINIEIGAATGVTTIVSAPGSGQYLVIKNLKVNSADATAVRVGYGESGGWVKNVFWGPMVFNTEASAAGYKAGSEYKFEPHRPLRLPENQALTADVTVAGHVLITGEVFVY